MVTAVRLTVLFEDPFWVCLYERTENKKLEVLKIVFGAEPKEYEVYSFLLENWSALRFSPPMKAGLSREVAKNPKRRQREVKKQVLQTGIGTKAQQALKLQQEQSKLERKVFHRECSEEEKRLRFELRRKKQKEKHKGR